MVGIKTNEMALVKTFLTDHFIKVIFIWYNFNTKMSTMEPVFTDDTLQHDVIHCIIWVRVRPTASAVKSLEVVVVAIVIDWFLVWTQLACHQSRELAVAAVTSEIPLCVQLSELVAIVACQTARKADTGGLAVSRAALDTSIQRLTLHITLTHK